MVTRGELYIRPGHPVRSANKALALGILANGHQDRADRARDVARAGLLLDIQQVIAENVILGRIDLQMRHVHPPSLSSPL